MHAQGKPSPRIVDREGKQDGEIRNFLHYCELIKNLMRRIQLHSLI